MEDKPTRLSERQRLLGLTLVAAVVLVYVAFYAPVLYVDDWSQVVYQHVRNGFKWFDPSNRRPLLDVPFKLAFLLFGQNIHLLYGFLAILTLTAAFQFYFILRRLFPSLPLVALLSAALFAAYPSDYTRLYLTMIGIRVVVCLTLLYAHFLLSYTESKEPRRFVYLLGALLSLGFSLGIYEAHLGLVMAWAALLQVRARHLSWHRRLALLSPLAIGLLFSLWRTVGIQSAGVADRYLQDMQFGLEALMMRMLVGMRVLVLAWTEPLSRMLGREDQALALLLLYGLTGAAAFLAWRIALRAVGPADSIEVRNDGIKQTILMLFGGLVFAAAGYVPIIAAMTPALNGRYSRTSLFATFGAAILIVSLFRLLAAAVTRSRRQERRFLLAISLSYFALALVTQAWVQVDADTAWHEQKKIWQGLAAVAPALEPDTAVFFVMPGYQERFSLSDWRRAPLSASWEVSGALRVLYQDESLDGDVILPDLPLPQAIPTAEGVTNSYTGEVFPYGRALFVIYDQTSQEVRIVDDLAETLALDWDPSDYQPRQRILAGPHPKATPWLKLVYDH